jgi:hypothetical protein
LWYTFYTRNTGKISIKAIGWGGLQYTYVNGDISDTVISDQEYLSESRLLSVREGPQLQEKRQSLKKIDVLSVAMGLSTVVSPQTGKGIKSVTVGEGNEPHRNFSTAWKLKGEELAIYTMEGSKRVPWIPCASQTLSRSDGLLWLKATFDMPTNLVPFVGGAQPNQTALVVNLHGLHKGVAYVNGFHIGRYWLVAGACDGDCAPPRHGPHCYLHWKGCGEYTQNLYHIPFEVLRPTGNMIVVFEETAPTDHESSLRNLSQVQLEIVHEHPG